MKLSCLKFRCAHFDQNEETLPVDNAAVGVLLNDRLVKATGPSSFSDAMGFTHCSGVEIRVESGISFAARKLGAQKKSRLTHGKTREGLTDITNSFKLVGGKRNMAASALDGATTELHCLRHAKKAKIADTGISYSGMAGAAGQPRQEP